MPAQHRFQRESNIANIDCLVSIGDLIVTCEADDTFLAFPLHAKSDELPTNDGIDLCTEGVVWEDAMYDISFSVRSTSPIRRATVCVNDHSELWMTSSYEDVFLGDRRSYSYVFAVDTSRNDESARRPFLLTCGFARVEVRIEFFQGADVELTTADIVSLDEPRKTGPDGVRAEEDNIRQMFGALARPENNQAAEWMFSSGEANYHGSPLSADENTDWAYAPIATRLKVGSDALDLIYDGFEDESD